MKKLDAIRLYVSQVLCKHYLVNKFGYHVTRSSESDIICTKCLKVYWNKTDARRAVSLERQRIDAALEVLKKGPKPR